MSYENEINDNLIDHEFAVVGLYKHNAEAYREVRSAFYNGENIVGLVRATGTGKTFIGIQLIYDFNTIIKNTSDLIIWVFPNRSIIEHVIHSINSNPNLDLKRDFSNVRFITYSKIIKMTNNEIKNLKVGLLIVDEFHHIGAPVWGPKIRYFVESHNNLKVLGMTAYTIRRRGTQFERDMIDPDTDELFSNKIVNIYDICDAWIDSVLPIPIFRSARTKLPILVEQLENQISISEISDEKKQDYKVLLNSMKKRVAEAPSLAQIVKNYINPTGKYIYFCPVYSKKGVNDIETIQKQAYEWFKQYIPEENIVFYKTTSNMGKIGKINRDAFYNDVTLEGKDASGKLRIMFAINQYNEGVHAPKVNGVILRETNSDIVFGEHLGRALSVIKYSIMEYYKYNIDQLKEECKKKNIIIDDNLSKTEIISKLSAPLVIDLGDNYNFIKNLENNLKNKVEKINNNKSMKKREIKLSKVDFDIEVMNQDLFETIQNTINRLKKTWNDYYVLAESYFKKHGNLEIPRNFKTINGYEYCNDDGCVSLGRWLVLQKKNKNLSEERKNLLRQIGMMFEYKDNDAEWEKKYKLAKAYFNFNGNLEIPALFKTINGYEYCEDEGCISLGRWIRKQRQNKNLSEERKKLLKQINMRFESDYFDKKWEENYKLAKAYFKKNNNLEIPEKFKTINGYEYCEDNGCISLGRWIISQRRNDNLSEERKNLLKEIGMRFDSKDSDTEWGKNYELAKAYFNFHGNLQIPRNFKTINGYEYCNDAGCISLGNWIIIQRKKKDLSEERKNLLQQIGMVFEYKDNNAEWKKNYKLAKAYFDFNGNLEIPALFKTINGYEYCEDEGCVALGRWIRKQRQTKNLSEERKNLLKQINMRFESNYFDKKWEENYKLAKAYFDFNGNLEIPEKFKTINGYEYCDEKGCILLGKWLSYQRINNNLSKEKQELLNKIGMIWYIKQKNFIDLKIDKKNSDKVRHQLILELKLMMEELNDIKNIIESKDDIITINKQFIYFLEKRKK